jgi:hypothetical protein
MKPGFGDDLPLIGGGAFLGSTVFKHYAHGFQVGRGEPDCGPGVGPAPALAARPIYLTDALDSFFECRSKFFLRSEIRRSIRALARSPAPLA